MHSADDWEELLLPEIERQQKLGKEVIFRADAAFAKPAIYEALEERGVKYAIRILSNDKPGARRRRVAEAACGETKLQTGGVVQELPVSSGELEDSPAGGSVGGASSGGVVPASGVHRNEPDPAEPAGGTVL